MIRFFEPSKTYLKNKDKYLKEIDRVLSAGDLILRKDVQDFEENLARFVGTKYCVALNSCTDALYLALKALKIGQGDEVLVPSRTFVATPQVIIQVGAIPVYYDMDGELDITEHTKAIIPVHIEGAIDPNMSHVLETAKIHGLYVIEDSAQALGAYYEGKKAGSIGIAGCFSFYPAKILGGFGDAGALVTNNEQIYEYVKDARNHFKCGCGKHKDFKHWGVNSRMDNIHAALLNLRIKELPSILNRRQEIAEMYENGLQYTNLGLPPHTEGRVWQDYIVRTPQRDELYEYLKSEGAETMKNNYPFPVEKLSEAQRYEDETLRLPCNENLEDWEIDEVISKIKQYEIRPNR